MGIEQNPLPGATPLDPNEAEGLIPEITTQSELDEFESENIRVANVQVARVRKYRANLLDQRTLKDLHKLMFGDTWRWAGSYRITQKSIGVEAYKISTSLQDLLEDVKVWLEHESYPPEELAARFHQRLVAIHPFPNGNGRFARMATDLLCTNMKWNSPTWGAANLNQAGQSRSAYITALQKADKHDFTALVRFLYS